jgi:serine/threonine protein kinase
VKVLDFGLAKLLESQAVPSSASMSPTLSIQATFAGMILGTAAYMSPEQARGRPVDKRADVWAFGCVLFEMLTGRRAFPGEDVTDTIAAVVRAEPEFAALPSSIPDPIQLLVRRALDKDRTTRLPDIGTARFLLTEPLTLPAVAASPVVRPSPWRSATGAAAVAIVAAAVTLGGVWAFRPAQPRAIVTRFTIPVPQGQSFTNGGRQLLSITPDGREIVYVANQRLYLRSMSARNRGHSLASTGHSP